MAAIYMCIYIYITHVDGALTMAPMKNMLSDSDGRLMPSLTRCFMQPTSVLPWSPIRAATSKTKLSSLSADPLDRLTVDLSA